MSQTLSHNRLSKYVQVCGHKIVSKPALYTSPCRIYQKQRQREREVLLAKGQGKYTCDSALQCFDGETHGMDMLCRIKQQSPFSGAVEYFPGSVSKLNSGLSQPITLKDMLLASHNMVFNSSFDPHPPRSSFPCESMHGHVSERPCTLYPAPKSSLTSQQGMSGNNQSNSQLTRRSKWSKVNKKTIDDSEWIAFLSDSYSETSESGAHLRVYQQRPHTSLESSMVVNHLPCICFTAAADQVQEASSVHVNSRKEERWKVLRRQMKTMTRLGIQRPISAPPRSQGRAKEHSSIGPDLCSLDANNGPVMLRNRLGKTRFLTATPVRTMNLSAQYLHLKKCSEQFKSYLASNFDQNETLEHKCALAKELQDTPTYCRRDACKVSDNSNDCKQRPCLKYLLSRNNNSSCNRELSGGDEEGEKSAESAIIADTSMSDRDENHNFTDKGVVGVLLQQDEHSDVLISTREKFGCDYNSFQSRLSSTILLESKVNGDQVKSNTLKSNRLRIMDECDSSDNQYQGNTDNACVLIKANGSGDRLSIHKSRKQSQENAEDLEYPGGSKISDDQDQNNENIITSHFKNCDEKFRKTAEERKSELMYMNSLQVVDTHEDLKKINPCFESDETTRSADKAWSCDCSQLQNVSTALKTKTTRPVRLPEDKVIKAGLKVNEAITLKISPKNDPEVENSRMPTESSIDTINPCLWKVKGKQGLTCNENVKRFETIEEPNALVKCTNDKDKVNVHLPILDRNKEANFARDERQFCNVTQDVSIAAPAVNPVCNVTRNVLPSERSVQADNVSSAGKFESNLRLSGSLPSVQETDTQLHKNMCGFKGLCGNASERRKDDDIEVKNSNHMKRNIVRVNKLGLLVQKTDGPNTCATNVRQGINQYGDCSKSISKAEYAQRINDCAERLCRHKHYKSYTKSVMPSRKKIALTMKKEKGKNTTADHENLCTDSDPGDFEEVEDYQWVSRAIEEKSMRDGVSLMERLTIKHLVSRQKPSNESQDVSKNSKLDSSKQNFRPLPPAVKRAPRIYQKRRLSRSERIPGVLISQRQIAPCRTVNINVQAQISATQAVLQEWNFIPPRRKGRVAISSPDSLSAAIDQLCCDARDARTRQEIINIIQRDENKYLS